MKTFTQLATDYTTLSNDDSAGNLALGKTLINISAKQILNMSDWTFNKDSKTISTGTGIQNYDPPYNMLKMDYVRYWYGGVWYTPKEIKSGELWSKLTDVPSVTSSIPEYWYVSNRTNKIGLYPASADSSGTIKMGFTKKIRDFSVSDYSTGSASVSANGTIFNTTTGTWNDKMVGRYIKVSSTDTPIDDFWFEITGIDSTGTAYVKQQAPNAVSGGSYTISEMIPLPEGFGELPLYYALGQYYQRKEQPVLAREYTIMYKEGVDDLLMRDSRSVTGLVEKEEPVGLENPSFNPWKMGTIS